MNVNDINQVLLSSDFSALDNLPHIAQLKESPIRFTVDFGLDKLPTEPGIIVVYGARQYGKSTWIEQKIIESARQYGSGSTLYLNGDEIVNEKELYQQLENLSLLFAPECTVKRLFIDEISAVSGWVRAIKRGVDSGLLRDVLLVLTGSKATQIRRGTERLPGRKGKLDRTAYYFTPVSYSEFKKQCNELLGINCLPAYILSGGCPVAGVEIALNKRLPEYIVEMIRDWLYGECSASGRNRPSLLATIQTIIHTGPSPLGHLKLARESGLANNTVAAGYVELLADLMCLGTAHAWDKDKKISIQRKPCKFQFINMLSFFCFDTQKIRTLDEMLSIGPEYAGKMYEWMVAQELWRRAAIAGEDFPENFLYWKSSNHEIDFIADNDLFLEVKHGKCSPMEFTWFAKDFPGKKLTVINKEPFNSRIARGITLEEFLLEQ